MKIKVDYTLTSDKDNSGEKIVVKGATAIVPAEYLMWKANTAYSYVFKVSDNTNGSTGTEGIDPAGLYPITFDAVVEDMAENNNYLTTVSELSITATQDKGQFTGADEAAFEKDKKIKVKVMQYTTKEGVLTAADRTSKFVSGALNDKFEAAFVTGNTYNYDKSPEQNLNGNRLITYNADNTGAITVINLPEEDTAGYWIVKVTFKENETKTYTKYAVLKVE